MEATLLVVAIAVILYQWLRMEALAAQANRDARYFEWWLRSLEERKEDRYEPVEEEEDWC